MNCFYCNAELTEQELEEYSKVPTCCSGRDCGCMGMPIEPPICNKCTTGEDEKIMENHQTKEFSKKVKILSITPNDKYNLEGMKGNLISGTLEVGKLMVITFEDGRYLRTSVIREINKTDSRLEVKTLNSVYTLKYI